MQLHCTRPTCPAPVNTFADLDNPKIPRPLKPKYCSACRMELILRGRYLPVSVLGQGGFGTAFLARDFDSPSFYSASQGQCVVKLFKPPVNLTPKQLATALRLFAKEAEVLERLGRRHPQIPNLYAYFPLPVTNPLNHQSEELFYLVQEFIEGEDLEKIRHRQGKFSEAEVEKLLGAMLDVLGFVHRNQAIHRDVKPSNIIQGTDGQLSLLDFGAVKEVTTPTGVQRGPTTICSPDYAPPEQILNGTVDATSDLYALAATCVVLLSDKDSGELRDSSNNTWQWHPYARVSAGLTQVLDRMLQARPGDRYPSAEAVVEALNAYSTQAAAAPTPQTAPQPQRSPTQPPAATPPAQPQSIATPPPPIRIPPQPISLTRFLGNAAFAGAEGGLLAIAAISLLGTSLLGGGVWLVMLGVLVFLQMRRAIEGMDLVIIAGLTLAAVIFFPPLHRILGGAPVVIVVAAVMAGGAMVAIAVIFRLIYRLVSRIM
ncbi:MAG: serine/threonine-protein kinase [Phormidesmis sp.]